MRIFAVLIFICAVSCSRKVYVVRHAEKMDPAKSDLAMDKSNPPLSPEGEERAQALKNKLERKNILHIYSTKYTRTTTTAEPLARERGVQIKIYDPGPSGQAQLLEEVRAITEGNVLIVGHSNTVDDLLNELTEKKDFSDFADNEYNNLFILSRKKNGTMKLKRTRYGARNPGK